ncbi:BMC domain-containing protein [Desulforamulus aquiferis]|uniref:BMC domain-containing protein n=1 Tax=Desulforamulus aquiferis TaxID=1397668 RepID=A0AAW7ZEX7_9FIRM|nr:BMC domain-containing protein [Desulforamulus aquiferis]MDO7787825.1 BMC domain-containing protein [Desulforamulus aquiferis]
MDKNALGLIEVVGLAAGMEAADAAVKAANIELVGYELTKGGGMVVIKLSGDVGAVTAAVDAGAAAASRINQVYATHVIPRPAGGLEKIITTNETVGNKALPEETSPLEIMPTTPTEQADSIFANVTIEESNNALDLANDTADIDQVKEPKISQSHVCNLCGDPACPRKKGDPRVSCIHYQNKEDE